MFDLNTYVDRRNRLKDQLDEGLVLFLGHEESPRNYVDNPYPFRQDSSFLYFWGVDAPGLAAVIDLDADAEILFGHDPTLSEVVWMGALPSLSERGARIGVSDCRDMDRLDGVVQRALEQERTVHILPQYRPANRQRMKALLDVPADQVNEHASEALIRAVVAQRSVKSDTEIAEIESAVEGAHAMHTEAMRQAAPGVTEQEVAGHMAKIVRARGGWHAFQPTFSVRGEVLHNTITGRPMQAGELALCDAGAEVSSHYASDITRVTPVGGSFTPLQKDIYQVVLQAQTRAIEAIRPGIPFKEVHLQAARDLTEGMKALGFVQGDVDEIVSAGAHALFFPHGLGHMMGLDVHDMEGLGEDYVGYDEETERSDQFGLNYLRLARALEPGFVLTVEPGVYFIPQLIDKWSAEGRHDAFIKYDQFEQYRDFGGIRIEDDVLVTEDSHRILGPPIPKSVNEVEAMAGAAKAAPV